MPEPSSIRGEKEFSPDRYPEEQRNAISEWAMKRGVPFEQAARAIYYADRTLGTIKRIKGDLEPEVLAALDVNKDT